jgi:hypothetical protein
MLAPGLQKFSALLMSSTEVVKLEMSALASCGGCPAGLKQRGLRAKADAEADAKADAEGAGAGV